MAAGKHDDFNTSYIMKKREIRRTPGMGRRRMENRGKMRDPPAAARRRRKKARKITKIRKYRKKYREKTIFLCRHIPKKMGVGPGKPPNMGVKTKKMEKNSGIFPEEKEWKWVVYGTGTYNTIHPAALS